MHRKFFTVTIAVLLVLFVLPGCRKRSAGVGPATITVYGVDDKDIVQPLISAYQNFRNGSQIIYKKFNNLEEYESLLLNEFAEGKGPDVFYVHNTWFPRHLSKAVPLVSESFTPQMFRDAYVRVAADDFIQRDPHDGVSKIFALPLYVDTLALYYNKDLFEAKLPERGKPAVSWQEFEREAPRFIEQDDEGKLVKGAIGLGGGIGSQYSADAFWALMLQNGGTLFDSDYKKVNLKQGAKEAIEYISGFTKSSNKQYSWNAEDFFGDEKSQRQDIDAFLTGKVASVPAYSDLAPRLATELKNVKAKYGNAISESSIAVSPLPQFASEEARYKAFANYFGLAVSRTTKIPNTAWDFVRYAGSQAQLKGFYEKSHRPSSRRDLISAQRNEPTLGAFANQLGYAASLRIYDKSKFDAFISEALENAGSGQSASSALNEAESDINKLLELQAPQGLYPPIVKKK